MRPNELGGQTLENSIEIDSVLDALKLDGQEEVSFRLADRIDRSGDIRGNIIPELLSGGRRCL